MLITENTFQDRAGSAVFVGGASRVVLQGNHITATPSIDLRRKGPAILIEKSSGVTLRDNTICDPRSGTTSAVEIGSNVPSGDSGVRIIALENQLAPEAKPVIDRRTK